MSKTLKELEELKQLQPETVIVKVGGDEIEVKPFKFRQLLKALTYISEMVDDINIYEDQSIIILKLIGKHPDQVIGLLKLATGKDDKFFDTLDMEEGVDLAIAAFKVNKDFFSQKLAPKLEQLRTEDLSSDLPEDPANNKNQPEKTEKDSDGEK